MTFHTMDTDLQIRLNSHSLVTLFQWVKRRKTFENITGVVSADVEK